MIEEVRYYSEVLLRLSKRRQAILDKLVELGQPLSESETLCSIPGIAEITATNIIGDLGNIRLFQSTNQINAYIRIDLRHYESGNYLAQEHVTKRGNSYVRKFLLSVYIIFLLIVIPILVMTQISIRNKNDNRKQLQTTSIRLPLYIASSVQSITS